MTGKKEFYDAKVESYAPFDQEGLLRYKKALKFISLFQGARILDIGCKQCVLPELLQPMERGLTYVGIDISHRVCVSGKNGHNLVVCDVMHELPFRDREFDFIFCLELIEHVENPTFLLREIRRVLQDRGSLLLSTPNPYYWSEVCGNIRRKPEAEGHIASFTYQTLSSLLAFNELRIVRRQGTFLRLPLAKRLFRTERCLPTNTVFTRSYLYQIQKDTETLR